MCYRSVKVTISNLNGFNYKLHIVNLSEDIVPAKSYHKVCSFYSMLTLFCLLIHYLLDVFSIIWVDSTWAVNVYQYGIPISYVSVSGMLSWLFAIKLNWCVCCTGQNRHGVGHAEESRREELGLHHWNWQEKQRKEAVSIYRIYDMLHSCYCILVSFRW